VPEYIWVVVLMVTWVVVVLVLILVVGSWGDNLVSLVNL
jgi:hypothetical protein